MDPTTDSSHSEHSHRQNTNRWSLAVRGCGCTAILVLVGFCFLCVGIGFYFSRLNRAADQAYHELLGDGNTPMVYGNATLQFRQRYTSKQLRNALDACADWRERPNLRATAVKTITWNGRTYVRIRINVGSLATLSPCNFDLYASVDDRGGWQLLGLEQGLHKLIEAVPVEVFNELRSTAGGGLD